MDENQKLAVSTVKGPLLITAGPGSGKTRTLVHRTAHMINELKISEGSILLATFTERAARELVTRLKGIDIKDMYIGTIHSICRRLLEENIDRTSLERGFKILDTVDQKFFIYKNIRYFREIEGYEKFMQSKKAVTDWHQARYIQEWVNLAGESKEEFELSKESDLRFVGEIYKFYRALLRRENLLDFTGIQQETYKLLKDEKVLEKIRGTIKYLMIDEYQDTNHLQAEIMFLIAGEDENICVVGDDDQGLYRFRGAAVENIIKFPTYLKKPCKTIKLTTNYRSHEDIIRFTNAWIKGIKWDGFRLEKEMIPFHKKKDSHQKVIKVTGKGNYDRWNKELVLFLKSLKKSGKISNYNQVAFLFRSVRNFKVKELAEHLKSEGISVYSPRSNLFFQREEIIVFIGILLKIFKPDLPYDDYNMRALYLLEKASIEEKIELEVWCSTEREYISFLEIFYEALQFNFMKRYFNEIEIGIIANRGAYNFGKITELLEKLDLLLNIKEIRGDKLKRALDYVFKYHLKYLMQSTIEEYEDMREYAPSDAVSFLTFHQSKGLEFPVVIVGSMEASPSNNLDEDWEKALKLKIIGSNSDEPLYRIDEFDFWRAYYTAFSRAQNLLVLTAVENRKGKNPSPSAALAPFYDRLQEWREAGFWNSKEKFLDVKEIDIKEMFSFTSHILAYERCPRRYRFFKKFGLQEIKKSGAFFGTLLHNMIENINKGNIPHDLKGEFERNYEMLKKSWGVSLKEEIKEKGFKQILKYIEDEEDILTHIIEAEATIIVPRDRYIIQGKIDLVLERDKKIEILDYKSGRRPSFDEHEKWEEYRRQLELYAWLYEESTGKQISKLHLYFLGEEEDKSLYTFLNLRCDRDKNLEKFHETAQKILDKKFMKNINSEKCVQCELKYYCGIS